MNFLRQLRGGPAVRERPGRKVVVGAMCIERLTTAVRGLIQDWGSNRRSRAQEPIAHRRECDSPSADGQSDRGAVALGPGQRFADQLSARVVHREARDPPHLLIGRKGYRTGGNEQG